MKIGFRLRGVMCCMKEVSGCASLSDVCEREEHVQKVSSRLYQPLRKIETFIEEDTRNIVHRTTTL